MKLEKNFSSFNGYKVKDANARERIEKLESGEISVLAFGAIGDGVTDDTQAFKNAVSYVMSQVKNKKAPIISIPSGYYKITDTIECNYFTRFASKGLVRIDFNPSTEGIPCFWFKEVDNDSYSFTGQGFYQSPLINGANGAIQMTGDWKKTSIAIQIGEDSKATDGILIKNGLQFVEMEAFGVGLYVANRHNYLLHFSQLGIRNCYTAIQFGDGSNYDSGENITIDRCTIGGNGNSILLKNSGMMIRCLGCSFDMNRNVIISEKSNVVRLEYCHIEDNGSSYYKDDSWSEEKGLYINTGTGTLTVILRDTTYAYGGNLLSSTFDDFLIRGKVYIDEISSHAWEGDNFSRNTLYRLFMSSNEVDYLRHNEISCDQMVTSPKEAINVDTCGFQNVETGSVNISKNSVIGDLKLVTCNYYGSTITGEIVEGTNPIYNKWKSLNIKSSTGAGELIFEHNDFIPIEKYTRIKPLIISNQPDDTTWITWFLSTYDENYNVIDDKVEGGYRVNIDKESGFQYYPLYYSKYINENVKYIKLRYRISFNSNKEQNISIFGFPIYQWKI